MNFKISVLISVKTKKPAGILIGVAMGSWVNSGRVAITEVLSHSVRER